jgi:hypothetical protein
LIHSLPHQFVANDHGVRGFWTKVKQVGHVNLGADLLKDALLLLEPAGKSDFVAKLKHQISLNRQQPSGAANAFNADFRVQVSENLDRFSDRSGLFDPVGAYIDGKIVRTERVRRLR